MDAAHEGSRFDAFVTSHLRSQSRSRIQALIESGQITLDGVRTKPATRVRRGQRVDVTVPPTPAPALAPEPIPLDVAYEDDDLLVINKPAGLTVHPGAGRPAGTLVNAVVARSPGIAGVGGALRPGIVHRLDKDTSGLIVVAKTPQAYRVLQQQVTARAVGRTYLALVHGVVPRDEGAINVAIARHPRHRTRMAVAAGGRLAVTRYRVMERFARYTLVEVQLVTGRTHQIRVHFAHIGHPVAGDPVYAGRRDELGVGRQALHAYRLQLRHPTRDKDLSFEVPPPPDLAAAIARARAEGSPPKARKGTRQSQGPGSRDQGPGVSSDAIDS